MQSTARGSASTAQRDPLADDKRLPARTVWLFGLGQAAEGIKNHSFTAFLLFYYTSVVGLSGTLTGAALMIALVFDAITDPLVAIFSDRTHSRWGRRHPYLFASAIPLGVFFFLVFAPPASLGTGDDAQWALFAWLLVFSVLTRAAMTLFHVPHMALGAELSDDFDERTRVVTARSLSAVIGTAIAVIAYFGLVLWFQGPAFPDGRLNPTPYAVYAGLFGLVITFVVFASAWGTRDRIPYLLPPDDSFDDRNFLSVLLGDMRESLRIRSFRALFLGFTLCFLAFGVTNALGSHNALYFWHISVEEQAVSGLFLLIGTIGGMAFWKRFSDRNDKKPTFVLGLVWFTVFAALPPILKAIGWFPDESSRLYIPLFMIASLLWSFGIAALMVVTGSMMADITDEDEYEHRRRRQGIFFGSLSFASKTASGLGTVIAGAVYDAVGLYKGLDPAKAPPDAAMQLGLLTGFIILILVGISLAIFQRYDLTRERHAQIRSALDARAVH